MTMAAWLVRVVDPLMGRQLPHHIYIGNAGANWKGGSQPCWETPFQFALEKSSGARGVPTPNFWSMSIALSILFWDNNDPAIFMWGILAQFEREVFNHVESLPFSSCQHRAWSGGARWVSKPDLCSMFIVCCVLCLACHFLGELSLILCPVEI